MNNMLKDLLLKNRSCRRFCQKERIPADELRRWVDNTRYCASGRNLQPLKYVLVHSEEGCAEVFPLLKWAGYMPDWDGPEEGERPAAYIVQLLDTTLTENPLCDEGLQLQALTLSAVEAGYACCIIKAFQADALHKVLHLPSHLKPCYVVAVGKGVEEVKLETMKDKQVRYWRTPDKVHHVPKRALEEILQGAI